MTQQQKNDISDSIKVWAFPILLALVTFFLAKMDKKIELMTDTMFELQINNKLMQRDIERITQDTNQLRIEVEDIKKKLGN